MKFTLDNEAVVTVRAGDTGEILHESKQHNAISDDFICPTYTIFGEQLSGPSPYCFILPDGSNWSGFVFDRENPYAPYSVTANNFVNNSADPQWKNRAAVGGYFPPVGVLGKTQLFFQWSNLPVDFMLRAIGLTALQSNTNVGDINDTFFGAGTTVNLQPTVFVPQTLVVLPSAILVHGISPGGVPDVLQISYFLSIVGTS